MDDAAALDATVDVFDTHAAACNTPIRRFLCAREAPALRLPRRHDDVDPLERICQEAEILEQSAACRQGVWGDIGNPLIVGAAGISLTQEEDCERRIDQQDVFDRVALFLAAITARLLNRILGARDAPFGPIVAERGEAGAAAGAVDGSDIGGDSSVSAAMAAASASATPRRWANAVNDRVGASPSVRNVARRTTKRT
jgi:hypothetical protein